MQYNHPTETRKVGALELSGAVVTKRAQSQPEHTDDPAQNSEISALLREFGGRREDRTRDLCIANAALSQLS